MQQHQLVVNEPLCAFDSVLRWGYALIERPTVSTETVLCDGSPLHVTLFQKLDVFFSSGRLPIDPFFIQDHTDSLVSVPNTHDLYT